MNFNLYLTIIERLIDEVIQLCCPHLENDQEVRNIIKEMVEVNNGDRNQFKMS